MNRRATASGALAAAVSGLVSDRGVADVLTQLVLDATTVLDAQSVAVLVTVEEDDLVLLNASSHEAGQIELLQAQSWSGPCVDVISSGRRISVAGEDDLIARWGAVGRAMVEAGHGGVDAYPMSWRGRVLGGLNVFRGGNGVARSVSHDVGQAFADVATLLLVHDADVPVEQIRAHVYEAVQARSLVEQAKGVLAHVHAIDPARAYELLLARAEEGGGLTSVALDVVSKRRPQGRNGSSAS